jgi:hypothetical protein
MNRAFSRPQGIVNLDRYVQADSTRAPRAPASWDEIALRLAKDITVVARHRRALAFPAVASVRSTAVVTGLTVDVAHPQPPRHRRPVFRTIRLHADVAQLVEELEAEVEQLIGR